VLQDFDITRESGDLRYQVHGNFGLTQSLAITESAGGRTAQISRTPFSSRHRVTIDGQQVAEVWLRPARTGLPGWQYVAPPVIE
jgi:hypothetical protein